MAVAHKHRKARPPHQRQRQRNQPVAEIIGRVAPYGQMALYQSRHVVTTVDATVPDYAFYDLLRRGKQRGYKLGALFARRIERVFSSWVFGDGVSVILNRDIADEYDQAAVDYTNAQLKNFIDGLLDAGQDNEGDDPDMDDAGGSVLLSLFEDAMGLGDQYAFVNADGSLSIPAPNTVTVERDPLDYRRIVKATITTRLPTAIITDEYRADGRTITTRIISGVQSDGSILSVPNYVANGQEIEPDINHYANPIGRIPMAHIAHGRSGNETNGHSIHEELLKLYDQYDDVIHKQLDGAKLLGNPILAFVGMENISQVIDANKPSDPGETYIDDNGNEVTRPMLNVDSNSIMLIGKGGDGKFIAPPTGFTADTKTALEQLFFLMLAHLGITESVWGGELSSARATSDTQLSQFAKELKGWQRKSGGWLVRLCKIWLQYKALTDPQIIVDKLAVEWPEIVGEDKALLLNLVKAASDMGLLTNETKLKLLDLVDDPQEEVEKGQAEAQAKAETDQQNQIALIQAKPTAKGGAIGEMEGYNTDELAAIGAGALRIVAEGI